jgi:hypothetical protein
LLTIFILGTIKQPLCTTVKSDMEPYQLPFMIGWENFHMELLRTAGESFYKTKSKNKGKKIETE